MGEEFSLDREAYARRVRHSLEKAEAHKASLRKTNTRLVVVGLVNSAGATLVAGVTSATGPLVGEGIPGWRLACIVAAILGFVSTVSVGLGQQLKISDRLADATQCVGRLRSLTLAIDTGRRDWNEITEEYEEVVLKYPEVI